MRLLFTSFFAVLILSVSALADASRLGRDLTPNGADPKASGMVPAWAGGLTKPPRGYVRGESHIDPYASDRPLFTITAQNVDNYVDKLMVGQVAMFRRHPSYKMVVYPSRRSCALPQEVYDATRVNAERARLVEDGNGIEQARVGVPFPIPSQAVEIYWNHNFHWNGYRYSAKTLGANVYPNGNWNRVVREDVRYNHYADPNGDYNSIQNRQFTWRGVWSAPPQISGSGFSMTNMINQVREPRNGFIYSPNTRKIIRTTPAAVTYDGPLQSAQGLRNSDNMFLFSGAPDRYNWRIIGKREMIVPYNVYKATAKEVDPDDLFTANHLNQDYIRYEHHRVWVVEASQKPGAGGTYGRRVFYADEDSWIFVGVDLYDRDGELVRFQENFIKNYYEMPACTHDFDVMYDLESGRYNVDHAKITFGPANLDDPEVSPDSFGSTALRRATGR